MLARRENMGCDILWCRKYKWSDILDDLEAIHGDLRGLEHVRERREERWDILWCLESSLDQFGAIRRSFGTFVTIQNNFRALAAVWRRFGEDWESISVIWRRFGQFVSDKWRFADVVWDTEAIVWSWWRFKNISWRSGSNCEVAGSFEAICGSCDKFRSCRIGFKKVEWRRGDVESIGLSISMNW